jgi:OOP family OmpA-OmpF porin
MRKIIVLSILVFAFQDLLAQQLHASEDSALVEVIVKDFKDKLRIHDQIIFEGQKTHLQFVGTTNQLGKFEILLPEGDIYDIKIKGLGENQDFNTLKIAKVKGVYTKNTLTIRYEPSRKFTLKNLQFDSGKSSIKAGSDEILNELIEFMHLKSEMVIEIDGHTDDVGDDQANLKLSQERANSVKQYLIDRGKIKPSRISTKGFGEMSPVASNETEDGRQLNRRTEVLIISE